MVQVNNMTVADILSQHKGFAPLQKGLIRKRPKGLIFQGEWKGKVIGKKIKY